MPYSSHEQNSPLINVWLILLNVIIFVLFIVGVITRLTDSGLSITEWEPIMGIIPPLSENDWKNVFDKYKEIPEYVLVNSAMTLEEFKQIYFWEWLHRFLARFVGVFLIVPLIVFIYLGKVRKATRNSLLILCCLFLLQAYMGWFMVQSGLVDRVDVSAYRLVLHLGLALIIFAMSIFISLHPKRLIVRKKTPAIGAFFLMCLLYIQILLGAFVAGTDAGKIYNTWPLIDDQFIPNGLFEQLASLESFAKDLLTIQFMHRVMGYTVLIYVVLYSVVYFVLGKRYAKKSVFFILLGTIFQVALGILTLLNYSALDYALAHHILALLLFILVVYHYHAVRNHTGLI